MSVLNRGKYEAWLVPYLEGGLDESSRAQMEARLHADPRLAAEAARLRRTLGHLRQSGRDAPGVAPANVPADLWPRLHARLEAEATPAGPPRSAPVWWASGVGAAAALALVFLWLPLWHTPTERKAAVPALPSTLPLAPAPAAPAPIVPIPAPPTVAPLTPPPPPQMAARIPVPTPGAAPPPVSDPFALTPPVAAHKSVAPLSLPPTTGYVPPPPVPAAPPALKPSATPPPTLMASRPPDVRKLAAPVSEADGDNHSLPPVTGTIPTFDNPSPPDDAAPSAPVSQTRQTAAANGATISPQVQARVRSQPRSLYQYSGPVNGQQARIATGAVPSGGVTNQIDEAQASGGWLDRRQGELAAAVQPPLLGENAGAQQATAALMAVRAAGALDILRARLEARRAESPQDVVTGRMLAAVYDFGFGRGPALRERRRVAGLDGATGEDWFALAQAEERGGSREAARAAYRRALDAPGPLSAFHALTARARG